MNISLVHVRHTCKLQVEVHAWVKCLEIRRNSATKHEQAQITYLEQAEQKAAVNQRGIWQDSNPEHLCIQMNPSVTALNSPCSDLRQAAPHLVLTASPPQDKGEAEHYYGIHRPINKSECLQGYGGNINPRGRRRRPARADFT